jgi:hypothetical protein
MHEIMRAVTKLGARVFRNHVAGVAWQGEATHIKREGEHYLHKGDVVIRNARAVKAGLYKGSSDLIGWTPRNGVAVFTAIEVKTDEGRLEPEQQHFIEVVNNSGGIAIVARSADEAVQLLNGGIRWEPKT